MTTDSDKHPRFDAGWHAALGQLTGGISPAALMNAYVDWTMHFVGSPDKQSDLLRLALTQLSDTDDADDPRFKDAAWSASPFNVLAQNFLAVQNWWDAATSNLPGVDPKHMQIVNFSARQCLDMLSPANFAATNPQVWARTREEMGQNLNRGARYWMDDFNRLITKRPRRSWLYGRTGACHDTWRCRLSQ